jgi:hypothetical protein
VNDDSSNDDTSNKENDIHTLIYYLLSAFKNIFPNIKMRYTTMQQEIESTIQSLKPKIRIDMMTSHSVT